MMNEPTHMHGLFHSPTPGRADKLKVSVPAKSYMIPADIVSGIGEGNTMAGAKSLDRLLGSHHSYQPEMKANMGLSQGRGFAEGGDTGDSMVPILASGGEYLVHPEAVKKIGGGDMDHGHAVLDHFVLHMRKKINKKNAKLKPPVGSKKKK